MRADCVLPAGFPVAAGWSHFGGAFAKTGEILVGLNDAKIEIASGTYAIVELPPVKVELANQAG